MCLARVVTMGLMPHLVGVVRSELVAVTEKLKNAIKGTQEK
jgi:hypothetical protein